MEGIAERVNLSPWFIFNKQTKAELFLQVYNIKITAVCMCVFKLKYLYISGLDFKKKIQ